VFSIVSLNMQIFVLFSSFNFNIFVGQVVGTDALMKPASKLGCLWGSLLILISYYVFVSFFFFFVFFFFYSGNCIANCHWGKRLRLDIWTGGW